MGLVEGARREQNEIYAIEIFHELLDVNDRGIFQSEMYYLQIFYFIQITLFAASFPSLIFSSILKMASGHSSETSVTFNLTR